MKIKEIMGVFSFLLAICAAGDDRNDPCLEFINPQLQKEQLGNFNSPKGNKIPTNENPTHYQKESEKLDLEYLKESSDKDPEKRQQDYLQKDAQLAVRFQIDDTRRLLLANNYDYDRSIIFSPKGGKSEGTRSVVVFQHQGKIVAYKGQMGPQNREWLVLFDSQCHPNKLVSLRDGKRETITSGICQSLSQLQNFASDFPHTKDLLEKLILANDGEIEINDQLSSRLQEEIPVLCQSHKFTLDNSSATAPTLAPTTDEGNSSPQ